MSVEYQLMTETTLTPSRLWKRMTADQRQRAAHAFWSDPDATDDQVQAAFLIAQKKKFRPKTIIALDLDRKAKHLATVAGVSDQIAARALITYHLAEQRPMMVAFLDALGIGHENGLIQEENVKPDAARIRAAVEKIAAEYPKEDVQIYLDRLVCQDPETWGALRDVAMD